jgi:nitrite reductase/ring-hydroxylating ferredoxin subunit
MLTDLVVGAWTSAALLDVIGGKQAEPAADRLIAIGVLSAVPTAAAGLSDWADLWGGQRRIGIAHAAGNTAALGLYSLSWLARKGGRRGFGFLLSSLGFAASMVSAYLGGSLSYSKGVGINQTAFEDWPTEWTPVLDEAELSEGTATMGRAEKVDVLLYRRNGRIRAISDRCSHRGCALHDGEINDGETVTCPCHGSTFSLEDGSVLRGPATSPQPSFEVRTANGKVEVRGPSAAG